jgi:hypothetical protein
MRTSLREECEAALDALKSAGTLRREGIDSVWNAFLSESPSSAWSRAFSLLVLGRYFNRIGACAPPRVRSHSHWRLTPSSNGTLGEKPSSEPLRVRSA